MRFSSVFRAFVVAGSISLLGFSASASDIVYREFSSAVSGMVPNEVEKLSEVYQRDKVIDLEASQLNHVRVWLDQLNQRFTHVIESEGTEFPNYSIDIMASKDIKAFIYKFRPAGQKVYRGHVFLSAGLIEKLFRSQGVAAEDASSEEIQEVLRALSGILAHEFMHPKQDELVKWEWREGQDKSRQNHGQSDEMSTDLMAIRLLRKAKLPGDSLLTGLELVFGPKPKMGEYTSRTANAAISSHPQDNLRLNIVRGALTHLRIHEGTPQIEQIGSDLEGIKTDLTRIASLSDLANQLGVEKKLTLVGLMRATRKALQDSGGRFSMMENKPAASNVYLDYMGLIAEKTEGRGTFTDEEIREWIEVLSYLRQKGTITKMAETWSRDGGGSGNDPQSVYPFLMRKAQRFYARIPMFRDPRFLEWFDASVIADGATFTQVEGSGLENMSFIFPKDLAERLYREEMKKVLSEPSVVQVKKLGWMWYGTHAAGLSTELETEIMIRLRTVGLLDPKAESEYAWVVANIYNRMLSVRVYQVERARSAEKISPAHLESYLDAHWGVTKDFLSSPRRIALDRGISFYLFSIEGTPFQFLDWKTSTAHRFHPFKRKGHFESSAWLTEIESVISTDEWKEEVRSTISTFAGGTGNEIRGQISSWLSLASEMRNPLRVEDRLWIIEKIARVEPYSQMQPDSWPVEYLRYRVALAAGTWNLPLEVLVQFFEELKNWGVKDPLAWLQRKMPPDFSLVKDVFRNSGHRYLHFLEALVRKGLLTREGMTEAYEASFLSAGKIPSSLQLLDEKGAYIIWQDLRDRGMSGLPFLRRLTRAYSLEDFDALDYDDSGDGIVRESAETLQSVDGSIHPGYARVLWRMSDGLLADFRRLLGVSKTVDPSSPEYASAFVSHYKDAFEFIQLIFNPDGKFMATEMRELVPYRELDELAAKMSALIPMQGLTDEQAFEVWRHMAAKRSNRYTDRLLESRLLRGLMALPEARLIPTLEEVLGHGLVFSERLKVAMLEKVFEARLAKMESRKGRLADQEVSRLTFDIQRFSPSASRFRDHWIESIAWRLGLSEAQVLKFIEPLKSFNYKAMDPGSVNLLSALSVIMEQMSTQERMAFVRHVQEPRDELTKVVPSLDRGIGQLCGALRIDETKVRGLIRKLDSFIQDASENERLILIEMAIGTRGRGLWYQNQDSREELKSLAGLEPGTDKRKLFETYLQAIPQYEQTITLSYLLASKGEGQRSELLRVLETFGAPGIKFAQMASVLSIFGEEHAEELAKAKDRASPPTRAEIFGLLREHYSSERFASIQSVEKLLGSGSLKYVVLVEFSGGKKEAVYLRRPHLGNVIRSTMELADRWMIQLREDPEFTDRYDYEFYLKALREQLENEIQFPRERDLAEKMAQVYGKVAPYRGWKFKAVPLSKDMPQTDEMSHFTAIENAVAFKGLSVMDRQIVGEYIIRTELENLLDRGQFDADRHLGNFLFDPVQRVVYPIDMGQAYFLGRGSLFSPGDRFQVARMISALAAETPKKGAEALWDSFFEVGSFAGSDASVARERFVSLAEATLSSDLSIKKKLLAILSHLTEVRIRLPLKYSMGVFKGLMILLNEDYAKSAGEPFVKTEVKRWVTRRWVLGMPAEMTASLRAWVANSWRNCDSLLSRESTEN